MFTDRERITRLEQDVAELRAGVKAASALIVLSVQAALDQMVDERLIPSTTRTEIFKRIRKETGFIQAASEEVARSARGAIPVRFDGVNHQNAPKPAAEERVRKEQLQLRSEKPGNDQ